MSDVESRFRAANDWAVRRGDGYACFPNFHQAKYPDGRGTVFGHLLLPPRVVTFQDVPRTQQGSPTTTRTRLAGAHDWARTRGWGHGFPTFHQADDGAGVVYGTMLVRADACTWRDVSVAELGMSGDPTTSPLEQWFRGANDYAARQGFAAGMPNGHYARYGGVWVCGIILFPPGNAEWADVPGFDLGIRGATLPNAELARDSGTGAIYRLLAGAKLPVPSWGEFVAMGYDLDRVAPATATQLAAYGAIPREGTLLRERTDAAVHVIRAGRRLHIPSPYAFDALGYSWGAINVVPNGSLAQVPAETWPSASPTPGSVVYVPSNGVVYYPLRVPTAKRHVAWGREVRTIELRGWLEGVAPECTNSNDPDWACNLFLDSAWAAAAGIDLNGVVKVGNVLQFGIPDPGATPRAWVAHPRIHLEISGWPIRDQSDRRRPPEWATHGASCVCSWPEKRGVVAVWPFDPRNPRPGEPPLQDGQYVRVVGAIVSDKPHPDGFPDVREGIDLWWDGTSNSEDNPSRWTEIHPPDTIDVLSPKQPTETFRGVVVAAPGSFNWNSRNFTALNTDIPAPTPRPSPTAQLRVREHVSPESTLDRIREGNESRTGARLTVLEDRVNVAVTVAGFSSFVGGSPGRFKAMYRVFWE